MISINKSSLSNTGKGEVMIEDILDLIVRVILGTQQLQTTLELINVDLEAL